MQEDSEKPYINPLVEAQLKKKHIVNPIKKNKKKPPEPSLRVKFGTRGAAINPMKVKPQIPGRLKSFKEIKENPLEKFSDLVLEKQLPDQSPEAFIDKTLSFADLMQLDLSLFNNKPDFICEFLSAKIALLQEYPSLQTQLNDIVGSINQNNQVNLLPTIRLFLPIDNPFILEEPDEQFYKDENELLNDDGEDFFPVDFLTQDAISISIRTQNFNKIHFYIAFLAEQNILKLATKGDASATEIAINIETNLEDEMLAQVEKIEYLLRLWRDNFLRVTLHRALQARAFGNLNSILLASVNCILKTIYLNDFDYDDGALDQGFV